MFATWNVIQQDSDALVLGNGAKAMELTDILLLLAGFVLGIVGALIIAYWQLHASTTGYRIRMTVDATKALTDLTEQSSKSRNRYRYSLGVVLNQLADAFPRDTEFNPDGDWPCLVDFNTNNPKAPLKNDAGQNIDRWALFDRYVRPVINDINPYSFLRWIKIHPTILQLDGLIRLCNQLEAVISELDAALEGDNPTVEVKMITESKAVIHVKDSSKVEPLRNEYKQLHAAWHEWLRVLDSFGS
jgi:hypothetical protein